MTKMLIDKEAVELALEALEYPLTQSHENFNVDMAELISHRAITALRQALEQAQHQLKPRCFADFQPNHEIDRKCQWCAVETECKGIEQSTEQIQPSAYSNTHQQSTEQEPVAWRFQSAVGGWAYGKEPPIGSKYAVEPLYTTPPQRKPLTDEQIHKALYTTNHANLIGVVRAIEAAHGITGEKE